MFIDDITIIRYPVYEPFNLILAHPIGVPKENGHIHHAEEMATVALALMEKTKGRPIPHLLRAKYQMEIGIHTGNAALY